MKFILGKKIGMSRRFSNNGDVTPVTLVEAGPCKILQKKNIEKDGYRAIQIGFDEILKKNKIKKSAGRGNFRHIKEFSVIEDNNYTEGDIIETSIFQTGDQVAVSGFSKGKGFQGGVRRWGFKGGGGSHGIKHTKRTIGSTGCRFPQRVVKGRKMPGRMGFDRITVSGLKIVDIDSEKNLLYIKGAIPGRKGTLLEICG